MYYGPQQMDSFYVRTLRNVMPENALSIRFGNNTGSSKKMDGI